MGWEDREIDELLYRLNKLDKRIPKDDKKAAGDGSGGFDDLSIEFIDRVHKLRKMIKEAQELKANGGASVAGMTRARDYISSQQHIRTELKDLGKLFSDLENLQAKELKKKKSKVSKEQLELRNQHLRQFSYQLELVQQLAQKGYTGQQQGAEASIGPGSSVFANRDSLFSGASATQAGASHAFGGTKSGFNFSNLTPLDSGGGGGGNGVAPELTDGQKQAMAQIEQENQKQDQILDEISKTILEAGQMAQKINELAKKQGEMLDNLDVKVEKVSDKMHNINSRMREEMEKKGMGMERFCINLVCLVILLGLIGVIINVVMKYQKTS